MANSEINLLQPLFRPLLLCLVFIFLGSLSIGYVIACLGIFFFCIWLLVKLLAIAFNRTSWLITLAIMCCWILSFAVVFGLHEWRASVRHQAAQQIVNDIEQYQSVHHSYPASLTALGLNENQLKSESGIRYLNKIPTLLYMDSKIPYEKHQYDFRTRKWHNVAS
jgi:hypothetical protein